MKSGNLQLNGGLFTLSIRSLENSILGSLLNSEGVLLEAFLMMQSRLVERHESFYHD